MRSRAKAWGLMLLKTKTKLLLGTRRTATTHSPPRISSLIPLTPPDEVLKAVGAVHIRVARPNIDAKDCLRFSVVDTGVQILAVTALATTEHQHRALDAGYTDFLAKPLRLDALIKAVRSHLSHTVTSRP